MVATLTIGEECRPESAGPAELADHLQLLESGWPGERGDDAAVPGGQLQPADGDPAAASAGNPSHRSALAPHKQPLKGPAQALAPLEHTCSWTSWLCPLPSPGRHLTPRGQLCLWTLACCVYIIGCPSGCTGRLEGWRLRAGCLHPDHSGYFNSPKDYMAWYASRGPLRADRTAPTVAVLLYRKHVITAQPYIGDLIRTMEAQGVRPIPIFINGIEAHTVVRLLDAHRFMGSTCKKLGLLSHSMQLPSTLAHSLLACTWP